MTTAKPDTEGPIDEPSVHAGYCTKHAVGSGPAAAEDLHRLNPEHLGSTITDTLLAYVDKAEQANTEGPIEFSFGDGWTMRLMLMDVSPGDEAIGPIKEASAGHIIAALKANPAAREAVIFGLYDGSGPVSALEAALSAAKADREHWRLANEELPELGAYYWLRFDSGSTGQRPAIWREDKYSGVGFFYEGKDREHGNVVGFCRAKAPAWTVSPPPQTPPHRSNPTGRSR